MPELVSPKRVWNVQFFFLASFVIVLIGPSYLVALLQVVEEEGCVRHVEDELLHLLGEVVQGVGVLA